MSETPIQESGTRPGTAGTQVEIRCDSCGAGVTWDPKTDALLCRYCGTTKPVPREEGNILERPLEEAGSAARGLGLEVRVSNCRNCGARVTYEGASTSDRCVYCGSAGVLSQAANRNAIRPESLVPLDVARDEVRENFHRWIRRLWFRPSALKKARKLDAVGIYVPFWTFDCGVHSDWSADAGYYYWVTQTYWTTVNGKPTLRTRQVRKIRWVPAWGSREDDYDDLLVNASKGLPENLVEKLGRFDTGALVPYRPEYLAGWRAEEYQVDLEQGWQHGEAAVSAEQRRRCAGEVPGDTHRHLRVKNLISNVHWKHVLLPIWSVQYQYQEKTYTVLVHGQNGTVVGEAPLSWAKILGLILALGIAALAAVVFSGGL